MVAPALLPPAVVPVSTFSDDSWISCLISLAAPGRCAEASARTSEATTAKPLAMFTRAGGLDGGIQRQDIGLEGDAIDHADDVADLLGAFADRLHGARRPSVTTVPPLPRPTGGPWWRCWQHLRVNSLAPVKVGGDLLDRSGGVLQAGCRARWCGPTGPGIAASDGRRNCRATSPAALLTRRAPRPTGRSASRFMALQHLAEFIAAVDFDVLRQVALGDGLRGRQLGTCVPGSTMERAMVRPPTTPMTTATSHQQWPSP